jgi:superfamily II DNA or RNA helicase
MKRTKDEVQEEAGRILSLHADRGIVAMATGTGKSKVAINKIIDYHGDNVDLRVLIVVPTEKLRDQNWKDEFYKWGESFLWNNNVERSCYASISKMEGEAYDLVILDECHNITPNNSSFFKNNTVGSVIGLTATPPTDRIKQEVLKQLNLHVIYQVTLDQAVEWGLVSPYEITVIYTTLDTVRKNIPAGNKEKPFKQTEMDAYHYLTREINKISPSNTNPKMLAKRQTFIMKRMRFIYNLLTKTEAAKFILSKLIGENERTLIFAGNIAQAETLCTDFFHSETNDEKYNLFLQESINVLSSVRSLNEGQNIPNLDNALIVQLNSNELHTIQRIGRVVRYRNGHIAKVFIICAKGTVDEKWLASAISDLDHSNITYQNFSQLKMSYD